MNISRDLAFHHEMMKHFFDSELGTFSIKTCPKHELSRFRCLMEFLFYSNFDIF